MTTVASDVIWYEVDARNQIVALSDSWNASVLSQQFPELLADCLLGKPLHRFITGDVTRMYTEAIFTSVRVKRSMLEKPYRCDTPELKRDMLMRVIPLLNNGLRVEHQLVKEEHWRSRLLFSTQSSKLPVPQAVKKFIKRCSVCNNLRDGQEWVTADVFAQRHPQSVSKDEDQALPVFYGVCPLCQ